MATAAPAAPLRCFLGDVSHCIAQHQKQQDMATPKPWNRNNVVSNKRAKGDGLALKLRLLGTVVDLRAADEATSQTIFLDDGTGIAIIQATHAMIAQIHVQAGLTLDCIVRVARSGEPSFALIADQLVVVQDAHAETLRWLELSYRNKRNKEQVAHSTHWGFPTRQISPDDIYRIIVSECQVDGSAPQRPKAKGLSKEDLAECLDLNLFRVDTLIQELQNSGQIYRNEVGLYLPL